MPLSRLRLHLAAWVAVAFLAGLGAADLALFGLLRQRAESGQSHDVTRAAAGFAQAIVRELPEFHGALDSAAREAYLEWPPDANGFAVYDAGGVRVFEHATRESAGPLRQAEYRSTAPSAFRVVAVQSTAAVRQATRELAWWFLLSAPLVVFLALVGGYFLAQRALAPLTAMARAISGIAPDDLGRRLPVRQPPDELDELAGRFNGLLDRLTEARERNRRFLVRVAHQLRTPLTVIRGESALGLDRPRSAEEHLALLKRVALAADQMSHRVEDLFLLAQAEAGERPPLTERVELDGTALECVDLMRGRAAALGRRLELGEMDAVELLGNEALVREAILELLENACRYGDALAPISVATLDRGDVVAVEIASGGVPVPAAVLEEADAERRAERPGLGLSIVRWIAAVHGGTLSYRRGGALNVFVLEFPAAPAESDVPAGSPDQGTKNSSISGAVAAPPG